MATNDITGDDIRTRPSSDKFRENWEVIFGKKEKVEEDIDSKRSDNEEGTDGKL